MREGGVIISPWNLRVVELSVSTFYILHFMFYLLPFAIYLLH